VLPKSFWYCNTEIVALLWFQTKVHGFPSVQVATVKQIAFGRTHYLTTMLENADKHQLESTLYWQRRTYCTHL